jgi:hypothetical protein
MSETEDLLYGLMEIADRQQAAVQAALEGLAAERAALQHEREQLARQVEALDPSVALPQGKCYRAQLMRKHSGRLPAGAAWWRRDVLKPWRMICARFCGGRGAMRNPPRHLRQPHAAFDAGERRAGRLRRCQTQRGSKLRADRANIAACSEHVDLAGMEPADQRQRVAIPPPVEHLRLHQERV